MERFGLAFDHLGLATRSPDKSVAFLRGLGYAIGPIVPDRHQNANVILCRGSEMPTVEVIFPLDQSGPLASILADRNECIYHVCYRASDLKASLAAMRSAGHRVIQVAAPQTAPLFENRLVSFYMVGGFGLLEIIQG